MKLNTKDMRTKILHAIRRCPQAVDDDKLLMSVIWMDEGWKFDKGLYVNLLAVSSPETIRRTRQKMVEEGVLKPSEKTTEARYQDYKQARLSV
jgi:hypothetical protein